MDRYDRSTGTYGSSWQKVLKNDGHYVYVAPGPHHVPGEEPVWAGLTSVFMYNKGIMKVTSKQQALETLKRIAYNPGIADQYTEEEIEKLEEQAAKK